MGAKLRVVLGAVLLALGLTGCFLADPYEPAYGYDYLMRQGVYGPGGGIGGVD